MPGQNYIRVTVTGVQPGTCPCCVGGDVARILGSTADCICANFVGKLKKHAQRGLPAYHTCLRDITGRGRLFIYMLQKDILQVELTLLGAPAPREMIDIAELLKGLGEGITATFDEVGYTAEELIHPAEEHYDGPPMPLQNGLVTPEERLAHTLATGELYSGPEETREARPPRPVPESLKGHR